MLAGADTFFSVLAGTMPGLVLSLVRAAQARDEATAQRIDMSLAPLWDMFKAYGSLRVMYVLLDLLGLGEAEPPKPILLLNADEKARVATAAKPLLNRS